MKYKNEKGNRYGKLLVIKRVSSTIKGVIRWECICDCGNTSEVQGSSLRNGSTKSCGCSIGGRERSGEIIYNNAYRLTKYQSFKRNVPFKLSIRQFKKLMLGKCFYCGRLPYIKRFAYNKPSYRLGKEADESLLLNGVDKIIPTKGYVPKNCVSCCKYCNRAKSDLSLKEFKNLIKLIYKNLKLNGKQ